jgi:hypothetical protein
MWGVLGECRCPKGYLRSDTGYLCRWPLGADQALIQHVGGTIEKKGYLVVTKARVQDMQDGMNIQLLFSCCS